MFFFKKRGQPPADPSRSGAGAGADDVTKLQGLPIGRVLTKMGKVTQAQVLEALAYQSKHGGKLGEVLVQLGHATPDDITAALAAQNGAIS